MQDVRHSNIDTEADFNPESFEDKRGHKGRERRCIASGTVMDMADMVRFVRDPDNRVTPDINQKLPGRGVWVSSDIMSLDKAIKTKAFDRGFKSQVIIPDNLDGLVLVLLKKRVLGLISMAMKAGHLTVGFDQVKSLAQMIPLTYRIEALDGSEDGRGKIRVLSKAMSHELGIPMAQVIGCFRSDELGQAIGRGNMVHGALKAGGFSRSLAPEITRLKGFVQLIPDAWPDRGHELHSTKSS